MKPTTQRKNQPTPRRILALLRLSGTGMGTEKETQRKNQPTPRRILALVLVMAIALQSLSGTGVAAEQATTKQTLQPEEPILEKYGIFASDRNLQLYCKEASLAADLYTGNDFICSGTKINIEGEANAGGNVYPWCGQFAATAVNQGHQKETLPDIRTRIEKKNRPLGRAAKLYERQGRRNLQRI